MGTFFVAVLNHFFYSEKYSGVMTVVYALLGYVTDAWCITIMFLNGWTAIATIPIAITIFDVIVLIYGIYYTYRDWDSIWRMINEYTTKDILKMSSKDVEER